MYGQISILKITELVMYGQNSILKITELVNNGDLAVWWLGGRYNVSKKCLLLCGRLVYTKLKQQF